jgi:hypothetical protein
MSVKEAIKRQQVWNYERCRSLTRKMENLQREPGWENFHISKFRKNVYYTECDEFKNFIAENNKNRKDIEFVVYGKYVNFVRTYADHDNNKIVYNLEKSMNDEPIK